MCELAHLVKPLILLQIALTDFRAGEVAKWAVGWHPPYGASAFRFVGTIPCLHAGLVKVAVMAFRSGTGPGSPSDRCGDSGLPLGKGLPPHNTVSGSVAGAWYRGDKVRSEPGPLTGRHTQ